MILRPTPVDSSVAISLRDRFQIGASLIPPVALLWIASRNGWVPIHPRVAIVAAPAAVALGMLFPVAFSVWHRLLTRVQNWVGARLLSALLGLAFILTILPIGLWLRARGRSFLEPASQDTYWVPARPPGSLKDQY